jgi:hypothetical protein
LVNFCCDWTSISIFHRWLTSLKMSIDNYFLFISWLCFLTPASTKGMSWFFSASTLRKLKINGM